MKRPTTKPKGNPVKKPVAAKIDKRITIQNCTLKSEADPDRMKALTALADAVCANAEALTVIAKGLGEPTAALMQITQAKD